MRVVPHHKSDVLRFPLFHDFNDLRERSFKVGECCFRFTREAFDAETGWWIELRGVMPIDPFGLVERDPIYVEKEVAKVIRFLGIVISDFLNQKIQLQDLQDAFDLAMAFIWLLYANGYLPEVFYLAWKAVILNFLASHEICVESLRDCEEEEV